MGGKTELFPNDFILASGLVFSAEAAVNNIASSGTTHIGIMPGANELVILSRSYGSTESAMTIELFEATFTGGAPARTFNRRLSSQEPAPATVMVGVTPSALTTPITGVTLRAQTSGGSAQLQVSGDEKRLYLKAATSYVVRLTNNGAGAATLSTAFDYRRALKGEWERVVVSA